MLAAVRERQNALNSACALPAEILRSIFDIVKGSASDSHMHDHWSESWINNLPLSWCLVSHVCRRWRSAALRHANLWADLSVGHRQPWDLFLERAQDTPLSVRGLVFSVRSTEQGHSDLHTRPSSIIDKIKKNLHRLRVLKLHLNFLDPGETAGHEWLSEDLPSTLLPYLKELDLRSEWYPAATLTLNMLSHMTPNLCRLHIERCYFTWGFTSPRLRELTVYKGEIRGNESVSVQVHSGTFHDLVHTLQSMPDLQSLMLADTLPSSTTAGGSVHPPLHLPQLVQLYLLGPRATCVALWSLFVNSPLTSTSVCMRDDDSSIEDIFAALSVHLQGTNRGAFTRFLMTKLSANVLDTDSFRDINFSLFQAEGVIKPYKTIPARLLPPPHELNIQLRVSKHTNLDHLSFRLALASMGENIRRLEIRDVDWAKEDLEKFLSVTKAVTYAKFGGYYEPFDTFGEVLGRNPLFWLDLEELALSEVGLEDADEGEEMPTSLLCDYVNNILERRVGVGGSLRKLELSTCEVERSKVERWREMVDECGWDGWRTKEEIRQRDVSWYGIEGYETEVNRSRGMY
ncbi:hypothetical protein PENSPDRAFT_165730 [Peniophora sp. CONT]|nr:hypothetical protein PENSPDRAFT_165730 [Peniophora sp. CONT]